MGRGLAHVRVRQIAHDAVQGHGLMQAIARVDRVFGERPGGLIVDYQGIGAALREALARYAGEHGSATYDVEAAVRELARNLEEAQALLEPESWQSFQSATETKRLTLQKSCVEHILGTQPRAKFIGTVARVETAFALAAGTGRSSERSRSGGSARDDTSQSDGACASAKRTP